MAIIPPRVNAVIHEHGNFKQSYENIRDDHLRYRRKNGKAMWKIDSLYSRRSIAETTMFWFKITFGDRLTSRKSSNQTAEAMIKTEILNIFKTQSFL